MKLKKVDLLKREQYHVYWGGVKQFNSRSGTPGFYILDDEPTSLRNLRIGHTIKNAVLQLNQRTVRVRQNPTIMTVRNTSGQEWGGIEFLDLHKDIEAECEAENRLVFDPYVEDIDEA